MQSKYIGDTKCGCIQEHELWFDTHYCRKYFMTSQSIVHKFFCRIRDQSRYHDG